MSYHSFLFAERPQPLISSCVLRQSCLSHGTPQVHWRMLWLDPQVGWFLLPSRASLLISRPWTKSVHLCSASSLTTSYHRTRSVFRMSCHFLLSINMVRGFNFHPCLDHVKTVHQKKEIWFVRQILEPSGFWRVPYLLKTWCPCLLNAGSLNYIEQFGRFKQYRQIIWHIVGVSCANSHVYFSSSYFIFVKFKLLKNRFEPHGFSYFSQISCISTWEIFVTKDQGNIWNWVILLS